MATKITLPDYGVIRAKEAHRELSLTRYEPDPVLRPFLDRFWVVTWDLKNPFRQEVLPYPSINLTFENWANQDRIGSFVTGVTTHRTFHPLENSGSVIAAMFRPGGFYPFFQHSLSEIRNKTLHASEIFGETLKGTDAALDESIREEDRVNLLEEFLIHRNPVQTESLRLIEKIVNTVQNNREILQVQQIQHRFDLSERSLSRIFNDQVGVPLKWVIRLFRLQEAVLQIEEGKKTSWIELANQLGYTDQAHFIRDFKAIIGKSPREYSKSL